MLTANSSSTISYPTTLTTDAQRANFDVALRLAKPFLPIFPAILSWNEKAGKIDKRPAFSGWQVSASSSASQFEIWWHCDPNAVPAIDLAKAGLVVLDLDRHPGGADGVAAFKALRNKRDLPAQPVTQTPSNGFHLIFRQPDGVPPFGNSKGNLPAGIDVRGAGGWIVAPGTTSEWGTWQPLKNTPLLEDVFKHPRWDEEGYKASAIPELPQWLQEIIRPQREKPSGAPTSNKPTGKRERAYAQAALNSAADKVAASQRGNRNAELNTAAFCLGTMLARNWIGRATVEGRLHDAALACGWRTSSTQHHQERN